LVFDVFFFFQAEDGIRDRNVTGVQTCALPICFFQILVRCGDDAHVGFPVFCAADRTVTPVLYGAEQHLLYAEGRLPISSRNNVRSEERRVGKERRCKWWRKK